MAMPAMGVSGDTFYRYRELANEGGVDALINKTKRVSILKNRADEAAEQAVTEMAIEFPAYGRLRVSNELKKCGTFVSGSGAFDLGKKQSGELQEAAQGAGGVSRS
jgi:hypothetical protein